MTSSPETARRTTPLADFHRGHGARMGTFAGYELPLRYAAGVIAEHNHTRTAAGLFDVSHMGQARLRGAEAAIELEALMPADLQGLVDGQSCYTMLTNDAGGIVDDLIVTRLAADTFGLVVNAAARDEVLGGIASAVAGRATLEHDDDRALLALQGPAAVDVLANPEATALRFMTTADLMIGGVACRVTRSGYTGEDGYEISVDAASVVDLAAHLLQDERVELAGLGARDSLRLEAGLCLYGQDIDTNTTPVEAGLAWTIAARRRSAGGFPGHARIAEQLNVGAPRRRVGIRPDGRAPAREGTLVRDDAGRSLGVITSGGFGPTVGGPVSMGYVETASAAPKTAVTLDVRGKAHAAHVVDLPFVPHRYFRG